jgi:hypothetical protein
VTELGDGVGETGAYVLGLKIREIPRDFSFRRAAGQHFRDIDNANSQAADTRTTVALTRIQSDA